MAYWAGSMSCEKKYELWLTRQIHADLKKHRYALLFVAGDLQRWHEELWLLELSRRDSARFTLVSHRAAMNQEKQLLTKLLSLLA